MTDRNDDTASSAEGPEAALGRARPINQPPVETTEPNSEESQ